MTATFDAQIESVPRPASRARAVPRRAIFIGAAAVLLIAAGGWWIALPASSVATDDAYVKADSTVVAPKIQGLIAEVLVRDNQHVKAGQPLIRIDPEEYAQAVAAAQADLESAEATLSQQDAQEGLAAANVRQAQATIRSSDAAAVRATADDRRYSTLVSTGDASHSVADQMRAAAISAAADSEKSRAALIASQQQETVVVRNRAQLLAGVSKAKAALALAQQNLSHTVIRSPVAGVVGDRQAQIGEYVQPGTQLMTVVPMDTIYVVANFKETQTARMLAGQKARVRFDAFPGRDFTGEVESFAPGSGSEFSLLPFEPATGNFTRIVQRMPVRIRLDRNQPDLDRLRPGLSADVRVELEGASAQ
jgi:membrane fusion protein, multidrug efflux system